MKTLNNMKALTKYCFLLLPLWGWAQQKPTEIIVSMNKITVIQVSGSKVKSASFGNSSIISEYKSPILTMQAKEVFSQPTNMVIVLEDSVLYFNVKFEQQPKKDPLFYQFRIDKLKADLPPSPPTDSLKHKEILPDFAASDKLMTDNVIEKKENNVGFKLTNINVDKNFIYYVFRVNNLSSIKYTISHITAAIVSKKKSSLPNQSNSIQLIASSQNPTSIDSKRIYYFKFASPIYSLNEDEELRLSLFEESKVSMGRHLILNLTSKQFNNHVKPIKTKEIYHESFSTISKK